MFGLSLLFLKQILFIDLTQKERAPAGGAAGRGSGRTWGLIPGPTDHDLKAET